MAVVLLLCVFARLGAAAEPDVRHAVPYGPLGAQQGDLYLPLADGTRRAGLLVIHGGGWINGDRTVDSDLSRYFATLGFVVFNIDYRLGREAAPDTHWPAQLEDCQLAIRWFKSHSAELRLDPARIGAVGDSAGATLAVFLGVLKTAVPGPMAKLLPHEAPGVAAVVDQFGIMDLGALGRTADQMNQGLFGTASPAPGQLDAVSPLLAVSFSSVPMLIVHGRSDDIVPFNQSEQLLQYLTANKVAAELIPFTGGHSFSGLTGDEIGALFQQEAAWLKRRLRQP